MDATTALARFEAAIINQLMVAGSDPAVESAAQSLLNALTPAARQLALEMADQAASEVAAQLPDHQVEVVLREGEPVLSVRPRGGEGLVAGGEDYEARITLRLPPSLKGLVEEAAGSSGDSVNTWVVKALSTMAGRRGRPGRRLRGTVQT
ncbi:MAG: type II toxin-antitoxin system HicB family antitoxin [Actinomycetota bacterium]|nr:type II toxin-antitoxin system HicB family antitoxin [Actinomycetota bacterium]